MKLLNESKCAFALGEKPQKSKRELHRVLFAISTSERKRFFPSFDQQVSSLAPAYYSCLSPDDTASTESWLRTLERERPSVIVSCWTTPKIPDPPLAGLNYVCHIVGSVREVVSRNFVAQGGIVTNWGSLISPTVAEHALLLILASLRNLPLWHSASPSILKNYWGNTSAIGTRSLHGRSVGLHGFGNIARDIVALLSPFSVSFSAFSENVPTQEMSKHGVRQCSSLQELFSQNEIIVECESLTPQTVGTVTAEHFKLLPDKGIFVNVARGPIVDEKALEQAVAEGRICVASDVFHKEPLSEASPLHHRPGMLISPHIGGPTNDWYPRCGELAMKNILRYLDGETPENVITLSIYDRST